VNARSVEDVEAVWHATDAVHFAMKVLNGGSVVVVVPVEQKPLSQRRLTHLLQVKK
jgi:hypothetical protein